MFDVDGSGDIDKDEMYGAMNAIGLRSTREEVDKLIDDIDDCLPIEYRLVDAV